MPILKKHVAFDEWKTTCIGIHAVAVVLNQIVVDEIASDVRIARAQLRIAIISRIAVGTAAVEEILDLHRGIDPIRNVIVIDNDSNKRVVGRILYTRSEEHT